MKNTLTLTLLLFSFFLVAQSAFNREYGPPSERNRERTLTLMQSDAEVVTVYLSEGGGGGENTIEFVKSNPETGVRTSQTGVPFPFYADGESVVVTEDSILTLARIVSGENAWLTRWNADGELLASDTIVVDAGPLQRLRLIKVPSGGYLLAAQTDINFQLLRLTAELTETQRATYVNTSRESLGNLIVLADGTYLSYTFIGSGGYLRRIDPQTGQLITETLLPESQVARTTAIPRFLTDPTDGSLIIPFLTDQNGALVPYIYRLDSVGTPTEDPYTLGSLPPEPLYLYGFNPEGGLVFRARGAGLFSFPDYRQPNNQVVPAGTLPAELIGEIDNPIIAYSPGGDLLFNFTSCSSRNDCDVVTTRSSRNGEVWRDRFGVAGKITSDRAFNIDSDPVGNIYLFSSSPDEEGVNLVPTVFKLNPDGDTIWVTQLSTTADAPTLPGTMMLRSDGLLFVQHYYRRVVYTDIIAPNGSPAYPQSSKDYSNTGLNLFPVVPFDAGGGIVFCARNGGIGTTVDVHRTNGTFQRSFSFNQLTNPTTMTRLEDNFMMLSGLESAPAQRPMIVKYDFGANREVWSRAFGNPTNTGSVDFVKDLVLLPDDEYLMAVNTYNFRASDIPEGTSFYRVIPDGSINTPTFFPQEIISEERPLRLAIDAAGDISFINFTVAGGNNVFRYTTLDRSDFSVVRSEDLELPPAYLSDADLTFSRQGYALGYGTSDPLGDGSTQLYLLSEKVITNPVANATVANLDAEVTLFPNPTSGPATLTVDLRKSSPLTLEIFDVTGRSIRKTSYPASRRHRIMLPEDALPRGMSFLRITDNKGRQRSLRVVR